jgi:ABC-2 type transport system permease protein
MTSHTLRVIVSAAKFNVIMTWRFFSWTGFALRFATPLMTLGAAWILFNYVYGGSISIDIGTAIGSSGYLSFITIGNAFYVFTYAAAFVVGRVMFWERSAGTIEATFMTPMSRLAYMAGIMIAAAINALVDFIAVFFIGLAFGFQITTFNVPMFIVGLLLTYFALFGIGLIANAITLTFRDRVTTANTLQVLFMVFSGIVCPIEFMPLWAQAIAKALPLTYGIRLTRASMLGIGIPNVTNDVSMLIILGIVYFMIGAVTLRLIERNLKKKALFSVF